MNGYVWVRTCIHSVNAGYAREFGAVRGSADDAYSTVYLLGDADNALRQITRVDGVLSCAYRFSGSAFH